MTYHQMNFVIIALYDNDNMHLFIYDFIVTPDQEVYEAIDTALEQAHSQVLERYSHPECPHRVDSISRVKG